MGRGQELLDAAREGDRRIVEKILGQICKRSGPFTSLRRGAGVNVQDDNGYTPLHHACLRGHKEIVQLLLSVDASPCVLDKKGANPLHLAAWKGDADVVNMLLANNNPRVDINQLTCDQETPLLIAARSGYVDVVEKLIANGADVNIKNIKDESALDLAAFYGRLETVQHLLRVRPDLVDQYKYPRCRGRVFPSTPLHRASKNGHKDVVTALINAGVDPNVRTHNGTALHEAVCFGKASVVRILLYKRADLHAVDRRGKTVHDLLADYSEEATKRVKKVIREFESRSRNPCDSEDDLPPFPVQQDYSPIGYPGSVPMKAPETQKNTNFNVGMLSPSPSSSSITKNHPQSFVKKFASKCLGLKAKFNSAPNISNSAGLESVAENKSKKLDHKSTNTLLIGNSKFFNKILSKKEESGEVLCTDEFDTISLDRLGTLNRVSAVNRSNRSCPGFKTSLPNISENTELSDHDSIAESIVITEIDCEGNNNMDSKFAEAVNHNPKLNIFEPRNNRMSVTSNVSIDSANLLNECYEPYEFSKSKDSITDKPKPVPPPRPTIAIAVKSNSSAIYENVTLENKVSKPVPATRTHVPPKIPLDEVEKKVIYENMAMLKDKTPDLSKSIVVPLQPTKSLVDLSPGVSRSSSLSSSDSMIDETNLEDILLSEKSKSFRHSKQSTLYPSLNSAKDVMSRTVSNASELSDVTQTSAIENVDCTGDENDKSIYLSMTGTLPNKKTIKKKVLFRHKTFTNIEADRNSTHIRDLPKWDSEFMKETLPNYHIRGTGHCMYKAPTVQEFIYIFNRDTLYKDVEPFSKVPFDKRDSYYETAICFCRPRPPKHHNSFEDLLEKGPQTEEATVSIDFEALKKRHDMTSSSFRCFCDAGDCKLHDTLRESSNDLIVMFSLIKKSISTPDITLDSSPDSTVQKSSLNKIKSSPSLEEPYAVVTLDHIIARNKEYEKANTIKDGPSPIYTTMSPSSTLSSNRPYSIKDISDVISLNNSIASADATHNRACGVPLRKSSSSEHSGHWSLQSCNSNVTIKSDASFKTCYEDSDEDSDGTLHSDDTSDAETIKSDVSAGKRPWVHTDSFRFGSKDTKSEMDIIAEESKELDSKFESGISVEGSESSSECEDDHDSGVPRAEDESLGAASLERGTGVVGDVRSGSGRRRWDEAEGTSEGDALSVSSAASSCAPLHMGHHHEYSKVSPTPPKKPPRRNLSVSPTHANSPSSGYSYELRAHARSQDDLDDIQGAKHYLKHGRSVDQYVDGKLSYSEYEENHNSPRIAPVPNPRPSLQKNRTQPVAITAMYENVVIKEQNPRRKLRRNNFTPSYENFEPGMENRVRKYSNQDRSSLESLLDDQSMNSPSDCEGLVRVPTSPTHYDQPPTPDHPPPSARQAENSIHERIRPLSQLIMEVVEEIRIRKKSQGDIVNS